MSRQFVPDVEIHLFAREGQIVGVFMKKFLKEF